MSIADQHAKLTSDAVERAVELEEANRVANETIVRLRGDLGASVASIEKLSDRIESAERELAGLRLQSQRAQRQANDETVGAREQAKAEAEHNRKLSRDLEAARLEIQRLRKDADDTQHTLNREHVANLDKQREGWQRALADLRVELHEAQDRAAHAERRINALVDAADETRTVKGLRAELAEERTAMRSLHKSIAEATASFDKAKAGYAIQARKLEENLQAAKQELANAEHVHREEIDQARSVADAVRVTADDEQRRLLKQLADAEDRAAAAVAAAAAERARAESDLREATTGTAEKTAVIAELRDELVRERKDRAADADLLAAELEQARAGYAAQAQTDQHQIAQIEDKLGKASADLKTEREKRREGETSLAKAKQEISRLTLELQDERDAHARTRNALEDRIRA